MSTRMERWDRMRLGWIIGSGLGVWLWTYIVAAMASLILDALGLAIHYKHVEGFAFGAACCSTFDTYMIRKEEMQRRGLW